MAVSVSKAGPYFSSGQIKFSDLRKYFRSQVRKTTSEGSETFSPDPSTDTTAISAAELLRVTDTTVENPVVPDANENIGIATSTNLKTSQFRNSIKYYNLDQGSNDTDLNVDLTDSNLWNDNLYKNIVKTITLAGTSGSTNGDPAVSLDVSSLENAIVGNVILIITGSILGSGGSAGTETENGGDGGHALYINTNGTGTVTVRTSGASAQVYGGGGGGDGGTGGGGSYTQSGTNTVDRGNSGGQSGLGGSYSSMCQDACKKRFGNNAYCSVGCYLTPGQGGCGCPCWSNEGAGFAECNCCKENVSYSNTTNTSGGAGGDAKNGGLGQGYSQTRTLGVNGDNGSNGGTNAGRGGRGGTSGTGGNWGENGTDGNTGDTGNNGNRTSGLAGNNGTSGGTAGRAVAGSGYVIDTINGVGSAYIGLK